jgi:hypothetical protein
MPLPTVGIPFTGSNGPVSNGRAQLCNEPHPQSERRSSAKQRQRWRKVLAVAPGVTIAFRRKTQNGRRHLVEATAAVVECCRLEAQLLGESGGTRMAPLIGDLGVRHRGWHGQRNDRSKRRCDLGRLHDLLIECLD